jgi:cysteine desulfurase / selenocysteine lyase
LYIAPGIEQRLTPLRHGGTGTSSESDLQPDSLPDRYEAGNINVPGIMGLGEGVQFVLDRSLADLRRHEIELTQRLLAGLRSIDGVALFGPLEAARRVGVVSLRVRGYDPQEVAAHLDVSHDIQVRAGLHCAPLMHTALGTIQDGGTIRMSLGPFTTDAEIETTIRAVEEAAAE